MQPYKLQPIQSYRTMYALTGLKLGESVLQASHYVTVLIYGRNPVWGVFSAKTGYLIECWGSRHQILKAHPGKILRRMQASWTLNTVSDPTSFEERERELRRQIREEILEEMREESRKNNTVGEQPHV